MDILKREDIFFKATAFHYKSFSNIREPLGWLKDNIDNFFDNNEKLLEHARDAKRPFQFLSNIIAHTSGNMQSIPITQDASASAYQIMSYLLLDHEMAKKTNLIPSEDGHIYDIYSFFLDELRK